MNLPVINLDQARFECTFGLGCEGICCRNGRPPVYPEEAEMIDANLEKFLQELRPEARSLVQKQGYLSRRRKAGQRTMRVAAGWCVFFNRGCVLHRAGEAEGDRFRYKPWVCAVFPIARGRQDSWYIRQKGFQGERWDLFCLDPARSDVPASESLRDELVLLQGFLRETPGTA